MGGLTVLGSSEVALIFDVTAIVQNVSRKEEARLLLYRHTPQLALSKN
jgi:hypothetical protein